MSGSLPDSPLMALAGCWDLTRGEHPHLGGMLLEQLIKLPLFPTPEEWAEIQALGLPVQLASRGHHTLRDAGPRHAAQPDFYDEMPIAPVFVRDLCGRVIHTGLLPLPNPPSTPTFPAGCADVPASMGGAGYLEQAIFTCWTLLDLAPTGGVELAGAENTLLRSAYAHPGSYPYKIRPSTFYADGWRLPQMARVFVRPGPNATALAESFMHRWATRAPGQDYEAFYDTVNGANWFEELFLEGVTVIPTLEGYNGAFQVGDDYSLQGVEPGRAVAGLHTVLEQRDSPLPAGTILEVVAPGYATRSQVVPAQVIVSKGPSLQPADALLPNLSLPHPHLAPQWGGCWLPTKPAHFHSPALWDWLPNGHFAQTSGPLWCPTHYVYASTMPLVRATRRPIPNCETLLELPEKLKNSFSPVISQTWYDTIHERTRQDRARTPSLPLAGTALDSLPLMQTVASVGYHPLPPEWPQLTQAAYFPETRLNNGQNGCPPEFTPRLAPPAALLRQASELVKHHQALSEPMRATLTAANQAQPHACDWLPNLPNSQLQLNVKRLFASRQYRATLTLFDGTLPAALFRFKESALAWRRRRYRLLTKYTAAWDEAERRGLSPEAAEDQANFIPEQAHAEARTLRQRGLTRVPAPNAPALQGNQAQGKLKHQKALRTRHGTR